MNYFSFFVGFFSLFTQLCAIESNFSNLSKELEGGWHFHHPLPSIELEICLDQYAKKMIPFVLQAQDKLEKEPLLMQMLLWEPNGHEDERSLSFALNAKLTLATTILCLKEESLHRLGAQLRVKPQMSARYYSKSIYKAVETMNFLANKEGFEAIFNEDAAFACKEGLLLLQERGKGKIIYENKKPHWYSEKEIKRLIEELENQKSIPTYAFSDFPEDLANYGIILLRVADKPIRSLLFAMAKQKKLEATLKYLYCLCPELERVSRKFLYNCMVSSVLKTLLSVPKETSVDSS